MRRLRKMFSKTLLLVLVAATLLIIAYHMHNASIMATLRVKNMMSSYDVLEGPEVKLMLQIDQILYGGKQNYVSKIGEPSNTSIAVVCAVTSRHIEELDIANFSATFPFFTQLFDSFCKTASQGYKYYFYIAHDHNDPMFRLEDSHKFFERTFYNYVNNKCVTKKVELRWVECKHSAKPAWAQSDAMMQAYLDGMEYFYRVNDDSIIHSNNWTETFIQLLSEFRPPNVGIVGPTHTNGDTSILTYEFTHKTHFYIFGIYYPRVFTDWFADRWITKVYANADRMKKPRNLKLTHIMSHGTRYEVDMTKEALVESEIEKGFILLQKWISAKLMNVGHFQGEGKRVIAFSLYGDDIKYTYGAVRNAQLAPIFFPGWTVRVYIPKQTSNSTDSKNKYKTIPNVYLRLLRDLDVEIVEVTPEIAKKIPPMMWRFMVADDLDIERFIIRDTDSRLSAREAAVVQEWVDIPEYPFHCIRDHPSHSSFGLSGGMIGGQTKELQKIFKKSWTEMMSNTYQDSYLQDMDFLNIKIYPNVKDKYMLCHDSVTCPSKRAQSNNLLPIRFPRQNYEHIGQVFNAYDEPRQIDIDILKETPEVNCNKANPIKFVKSIFGV